MVGIIAAVMILALAGAVFNLLPKGSITQGVPRAKAFVIVALGLIVSAVYLTSMYRDVPHAVPVAVPSRSHVSPTESFNPAIPRISEPPGLPSAGPEWVVIAPVGKWSERVTIPEGYACTLEAANPILVEKNGKNIHRDGAAHAVQLGRIQFVRFKSDGDTQVTIIGRCVKDKVWRTSGPLQRRNG